MNRMAIVLLLVTVSDFAQWNQVGQSLNAEISSLIKSNNVLFVTTKTAGVFSTADEVTWVARNTGLTDLQVNDIAQSNGRLAVGTKNSGVFISTDNGNSWQLKSNGLTIPYQALPNTETIIYSGHNMIEGGGYGIFTSTDYGENWTRTLQSVYSIVAGLYRSTNYVYAGVGPLVYRSSDDGLTWNQVVNAHNVAILRFVTFPLAAGQDRIFVGTSNGIFYSENNGTSWVEKNIMYKYIYDLVKYGNTVFAACKPFMTNESGHVYVSTDFGNNWQNLTDNISSIPANQVKKILIDGEFIYVGTSLGNVYKRRLSGIVSHIEESTNSEPIEFHLNDSYPNPFNSTTKISFSIPTTVFVTINVYDVFGKQVATLVNEQLNAGAYTYNLDTSELPNGVYLYTLQAGKFSDTKKMLLVR